MRTPSRALLAALFGIGLVLAGSAPAFAHGEGERDVGTEQRRERLATGFPVPVLASPNVRLVTTVPDALGISGVFSPSAPLFVLSTLKGISVYDVTDPAAPRLTGALPLPHFQNEAITYGERRAGDRTERFVLVGFDLVGVTPTEPEHLGTTNEVAIIDVTDPAQPRIRSLIPTTTNTHTAACIRATACEYAYTAGEEGTFSVLDLTDLDAPREVDSDPTTPVIQPFTSPGAGPNEVFTDGAGHKWNFDEAGFGIHTGSGGSAVFDVREPAAPRLVTTTDAEGLRGPWNDFIHHNSARPNASRFVPDAPPDVEQGNVALITEEDLETTDCATAGSFQTWHVQRLDGTPQAVRPLDRINPVSLGEGPVLPQMAMCSAHWFDHHPSGIVVQGFYQGGVRLIDVRDPANLAEYGHFATGVSEVWDTYWVPGRDANGVATGPTDLVYAVDLVRGLDVLQVDLPTGASTPVRAAADPVSGGLLATTAALLLAAAAANRRARRR